MYCSKERPETVKSGCWGSYHKKFTIRHFFWDTLYTFQPVYAPKKNISLDKFTPNVQTLQKILLPELFFLKFPFLVVFFHPHFCTSKNHFNQTDQFASLQKERQEDRSFEIGIGREEVRNSGKLILFTHFSSSWYHCCD